MPAPDKAAQRSTLIFQLGELLAPLSKMAKASPPPTSAEYFVAAARGIEDMQGWSQEVLAFATIGGCPFGHLIGDIQREPHNLFHELPQWAKSNKDDASRQSVLRDRLEQCRQMAIEAIDRVPIEWEPILSAQKTPFSVYMKIRDAIGTAKRRVHYFDRYLDTDFFHLYMRDLPRTLEVRLVTTKGKVGGGFGVANVLAVSRLAAVEFGNYRLIECSPPDMHDRNLRIDDTVFYLGTSISDAGEKPTNFGPGDSTPHGHGVLDSIMGKGTVVT